MAEQTPKTYNPTDNLLMVVGNYGSGKTEVAVNLSLHLKRQGKEIFIADLDIVNPYFRCREARDLMDHNGIHVVVPPGAQQFADLPIILPEIKGMLAPKEKVVSIFDVGGDDVGARLLSSFAKSLGDNPYRLLQVINSRRPFTHTVAGCLKMIESIEKSSRLKVSGLIANSHLTTETTAEVVLEGYDLARQVSSATGIPIEFVAAMEELAKDQQIRSIEAPILPLERIMLPPWLRRDEKRDSSEHGSVNEPASRTKPIGRP